MSRWLKFTSVTGAVLIAVALGRAALGVTSPGADPGAVVDFALLSAPGVVLWYVADWLPRTDFDPVLYPRVLSWSLGGVGVLFGFTLLRVSHPGVTVDWSVGTQALGVAIGSLGGLAIGIREAEAITRAEELADRNAELAARESELERQNERLDEFTSIVSHDLRNPLNVAEGRLALARADRDGEHLAAVADALDRMEALVEDLLALARQGEAVSDREAVGVGALARSCWEGVDTDGATLHVTQEFGVYADRLRLQQVLQNLLRNAVEHGGDDVTVTIGVLDDGQGFYVADDGDGIPDADREAVLEHGYTTSEDGTGFGLAIVDRIADAHDWTLAMTESEDGGARFEIRGVVFA